MRRRGCQWREDGGSGLVSSVLVGSGKVGESGNEAGVVGAAKAVTETATAAAVAAVAAAATVVQR